MDMFPGSKELFTMFDSDLERFIQDRGRVPGRKKRLDIIRPPPASFRWDGLNGFRAAVYDECT